MVVVQPGESEVSRPEGGARFVRPSQLVLNDFAHVCVQKRHPLEVPFCVSVFLCQEMMITAIALAIQLLPRG